MICKFINYAWSRLRPVLKAKVTAFNSREYCHIHIFPQVINWKWRQRFLNVLSISPVEGPPSSRAFALSLKSRSVSINQHSRQSGDSPFLSPGDCTNEWTKEQTSIVTKLLTTLYTIGNGSKRENVYVQYIIAFGLVSSDWNVYIISHFNHNFLQQ
jgi:hypothetical protein